MVLFQKNILETVRHLPRRQVLTEGHDIHLLKFPKSHGTGRTKALVFPDLNSGNMGYKITQRFSKAEAYGPLIQGLLKPVNDLSRGGTPNDIMIVSAITIARAK